MVLHKSAPRSSKSVAKLSKLTPLGLALDALGYPHSKLCLIPNRFSRRNFFGRRDLLGNKANGDRVLGLCMTLPDGL